MDEMKERRHILFVGAQQAGKTTMMCGWYHLAKDVYNAEPIEEFEQTADLLRTYHRYLNNSIVNPTVQGDITRALFNCRRQYHQFDLQLTDYSGEDIVSGANKFLHGQTNADNCLTELEKSFVEDLKRADWIVLVHDPIRVAEGTVEQLTDTLWLANALPRVMFDGELGTVSNVTVYLSRADEASSEIVAKAESNIREATSRSNLSMLPIKCGNAKVWERDANGDSCRSFEEFFAQTMLKVLEQPKQIHAGKASDTEHSQKSIWLSAIIATLVIGLIVYLMFGYPYERGGENTSSLATELVAIEKKAEKSIDHSQAQNLLQDLKQIELRIGSQDLKNRADLDNKILSIRTKLESVSAPKAMNAIIDEIRRVRILHGPNLAKFYSDLRELAKSQSRNDSAWDKASRDEWELIESFCTQVMDGVAISLADSSFKGPQWWTSYVGEDDLQLEIWIAKPGDPQPFDLYTSSHPSLGTAYKGSVASGKEYSVIWPGAVSERSSQSGLQLKVRPDDQIWVRVFSYDMTNKTLCSSLVSRSGPLGLDWFNVPQKLKATSGESTLIVRTENALQIPGSIQKAFKD